MECMTCIHELTFHSVPILKLHVVSKSHRGIAPKVLFMFLLYLLLIIYHLHVLYNIRSRLDI